MRILIAISTLIALFSFGAAILVSDIKSTNYQSPVNKLVMINQSDPSSNNSSDLATIESKATTSTSTITATNTVVSLKTSSPSENNKVVEPKATKVVVNNTKTTIPKEASTTSSILTTKNNPISWGVFAGSNTNTIKDFESRVEENPDYLAYFVHWGNDKGTLPNFLINYAYNKNRTLVIFWEASDYKIGGTNQPNFAYKTILRGDWDNYFSDFAKQLKDYSGPIILVPFSELNGNWTPWSGTLNGNTPEEAVAAFRYVHDYFKDLNNVKIGWAVNSVSVPNTQANKISEYYPGDDYVDIVGVDGFNMDYPWMTFNEIFADALSTISQYNKPIFIFSFASAQGYQKADWLHDALYNQMPKYPLLKAWIYFNQNKERNWLLWSDEETLKVFKQYVANEALLQ